MYVCLRVSMYVPRRASRPIDFSFGCTEHMHKNISWKYPRSSHVQAIEATHMMSIANLFMRPNEQACKPLAPHRWSTITYLRKRNTSNHERTSNTEQSRKNERVIRNGMQLNKVELPRTRMSTWRGNGNSVNMKTQREKHDEPTCMNNEREHNTLHTNIQQSYRGPGCPCIPVEHNTRHDGRATDCAIISFPSTLQPRGSKGFSLAALPPI